MGLIRVLSPDLVNRIAAGECIERPSNVVKELVENALDAGAGRIDVNILEGGRQLVQVTDDGAGMEPDDLRLAIEAHATSKIRDDDDLFNIHTMGFRGEALPSIGSISRLKITSRTRESDVAHAIQSDAGVVDGPTPCAGPPGTSVEVRDLFYCVPARRKFLRTNQTEMGHITEQFARIALAHPAVAFSLKHQERKAHTLTETADRRQRIGDFYGPELAEVLLPIRREGNGVLVEGWVAPPKESRGSSKWEYVFVNGRYVRDRFVSHAIKEAYRSLIDPSRYPVTFLFITINPEQIDVNVHPTKIEIRWRDSNYIHGQVLAALREKFLSTNLDHTLQTHRAGDVHREGVRQAMVDFFTRAQPGGRHEGTEPRRHGGVSAGTSAPAIESVATPIADRERWTESAAEQESSVGPPRPTLEQRDTALAEEASVGQIAATEFQAPRPATRRRFVQIKDAFIVTETEEGLAIIDQHALHERILYEKFRARIAGHPLESQRLLLPEVVRVSADQIEALDTHAELLDRLGIELTASGPQSVTLHAFPSLLERIDARRFVKDLLDILCEGGSRPSMETLLHELLDMMACKAAVKAGDPLTDDEIDALLRQREVAERSSNCPHGRPTTLHLTMRDLERQFKRR